MHAPHAIRQRFKILLASVFGTALEFYDFTLYGVFIHRIAHTFFPAEKPIASLLFTFGGFLAGFIMRPFGAGLFGFIGDRYGRKKALSLSVILMGIPTFIMGILPGADVLGLAAPFLIILCRLLQGACAGGEYNGAAIYALEHLGVYRPGLMGAIIASAGGIGGVTAMGMGYLVSLSTNPYAWRVPFLLGLAVSILGYIMRLKLGETPEFQQAQEQQKQMGIQASPLRKILQRHKIACVLTFQIGALDGALAYVLVGFLNIYFTHYLLYTESNALLMNTSGLFLYLVLTPVMGHLFDVGGTRFLKIFLVASLGLLPISFQLFHSPSLMMAFIGEALFVAVFSLVSGCQHAFMQNLFPTAERYSGISLSFNLGSAFLGGSAPLILTTLLEWENTFWIPSLYLGALVIGVLILITLHKHTTRRAG